MGKKKKNGGSAAGGKTRQKDPQPRNQAQSPENLEQSLQKRSRFATEHLKQLEALYREGLSLEDEILEDEEPSTEELQGALDDLETMRDVRNAAEYISDAEYAAASPGRNETGDIFRPETAAEKGSKLSGRAYSWEKRATSGSGEPYSPKKVSPDIVADGSGLNMAASEEMFSEGIALEKLTEANVTLEELKEAGITTKSIEAAAALEEENQPEAGTSGEEEFPETEPPEDRDFSESKALEDRDLSEAGVPGDGDSTENGVPENGNLPEAGVPEEGDLPEVETPGDGNFPENEVQGKANFPENGGSGGGNRPDNDGSGDDDSPAAGGPGDGDQPSAEGDANGDDAPATRNSRRKCGLSKKTGMIQIAVFFVALFGISIVGLCMPLRPTESQIEKRTLTEFPEFTWESFLSGDYTDQISTWYADTFPFRETLLSWYTNFKKLFGLQGNEVYIGDVIVADDIPDIPDEDETTSPATATDATATDAETETTTEAPTETTTEAPTETATVAPTETTTEEPTETATEAQTTTVGGSDSTVVGEQIGSVYIYGDQAFSVYGFSLEMSDNYAKMISLAAEELAGKATVYNILVPLSYGIQLDSSLWESMGWSDEEKAIKYMYSQMSDDVKTVSVYQTLLDHKDEYIYFRTDHHWTALGAYYAYQCFAGVKGITANALDSFETMTFENYLGSLYSQSNESEALANNPDTIIAYVPRGTNKMTITQKDGSILDWRVIYDVTTWRNDSKYSCFIGGDNPFSVIENPEITDGSSVLLVKESFGNAFAPFLVDHYQYVYVIDFRYYSGHLEDVVDTYGIQDVIFMNNLNSAGGSLQNYLQSFIEPEEETGQ